MVKDEGTIGRKSSCEKQLQKAGVSVCLFLKAKEGNCSLCAITGLKNSWMHLASAHGKCRLSLQCYTDDDYIDS